jgi:hypothetical protein
VTVAYVRHIDGKDEVRGADECRRERSGHDQRRQTDTGLGGGADANESSEPQLPGEDLGHGEGGIAGPKCLGGTRQKE